MRCSTLRPEGPAALPLGKGKSVETMLKSVPRNSWVVGTTDEVSGEELGCLDLSSS